MIPPTPFDKKLIAQYGNWVYETDEEKKDGLVINSIYWAKAARHHGEICENEIYRFQKAILAYAREKWQQKHVTRHATQ